MLYKSVAPDTKHVCLLYKPLCHSLVIHRLSLLLALLWFLSLQTGERMLGTVTVGMCEPIATSCRESNRYEYM